METSLKTGSQLTFDFTGRVAVVTGAARGVGRSLVQAFARAGAKVVAVDRDAAGLQETLSLSPDGVAAVVSDISQPEGAQATVDAAIAHFGRLDICVNNAAIAPHTSLLEERAEVWDQVYAVNCRGTFLMTQAAACLMIAGGHGGRIVNFSSAASRRGSPGATAYASSRAAVESFTRVAAIELAPHGILVNTVSPGLIDTQPKPLPPMMSETLSQRIPTLPLARPGQPEEVVAAVLFLASDASSYISGSVMMVDGASAVGSRFSEPVVDDDIRYDWVTGHTR